MEAACPGGQRLCRSCRLALRLGTGPRDELSLPGCGDETAGCQQCLVTVAWDESTVLLTLPDTLEAVQGRYLEVRVRA